MAEARLPNYRRGDTWRLLVTPPTDPVLTTLLPFTGRELWFTVKPQTADAATDTDALIQVRQTIAAMPTVSVAGVTKYLLVIPSTLTNIPDGKYRADVQLVLPGAVPEVDTLVSDERFTVTKDVTRKTA